MNLCIGAVMSNVNRSKKNNVKNRKMKPIVLGWVWGLSVVLLTVILIIFV